MPVIPSNAGKKRAEIQSADAVEVARTKLIEVLGPYFKGKTAPKRLANAVDDCIQAIAGFITTKEVTGQKLGGTVMTEAAATRNPVTGLFNKAPRNL